MLGLKPIRFNGINYLGERGQDWMSTDFNLSKLITQNILYSAYHESKTIAEISELLGTPKGSIKEEVILLEDNGFIDKVSEDKYITNILIHDLPIDVYEEVHSIYKVLAKNIVDNYILKLTTTPIPEYLYVPENDVNFFLWSLITLNLCHKLEDPQIKDNLQKHYIKRNDGSDNIVFTTIEKEYKHKQTEVILFADYPKELYPFYVWQFNSEYDDRIRDWSRAIQEGFEDLHDYLKNKPTSEDTFKTLINRSLLIKDDTQYYANILISKGSINDFLKITPPIPNEIIEISEKISNNLIKITNHHYPPHMQKLAFDYYQNILSNGELIPHVLDILVKDGILKKVKEHQKKTVNMIMVME